MIHIKEFIERVGIGSQEELAEKLDVTNVTVSKWANGTGTPTFKVCQQLLDMGMTVEELFGKPYPSTAKDLDSEFKRKADYLARALLANIEKL